MSVAWLKENKVAVGWASLFSVSAVIVVLPLQESNIAWQPLLIFSGYIIQGASSFFILLFFWSLPELYVVGVGVWGFLFGRLMRNLWKGGTAGRAAGIVLILANLAFGALAGSFAAPAVEPEPYTSCERYFSTTTGFRIVGYAEGGFDPDGYTFYLATHDAGTSWAQFMYNSARPPAHVNCNTAALAFDDSGGFYAVWDEALAITHDGGRTWLLWNPQDFGYHVDSRLLIDTLVFEDHQHGRMALSGQYAQGRTALYTADGGQSWGSEGQ